MTAGGSTPAPARRRHEEPAAPVVPPSPSTIDLHTHSRRSDGVLEPSVLVRAAVDAGVTLLALTDHDTLAGIRQLHATGGVPPEVELMAGVEINAITPLAVGLGEGELHVLGLGVDPASDAFEAALARQRSERRLRFDRTLARLREIGLDVDAGAAALVTTAEDALGRPTVARLLVAAGFASSVEDAFARLLSRGRPGYVPRGGLGPLEAISAIRGAGGLAVLAHFSEAPDRLGVVRELVDAGLGGLEVYYRAWDQPTVDAVAAVALDLGLVPTGGSDYHGDTGTYAEAHAGMWVPPLVGDAVRNGLRDAASEAGG